MSSKQLGSILERVPSATANGQSTNNPSYVDSKSLKPTVTSYTRIVGLIPQILKDEIKEYVKTNKGETETTVILKALKKMGFNVDPAWIVDKRSTR